ncbi:MAG TPA: DNA-processing protein DprA [Stellaceae bacterium]|nr:DNA-processing protein DprA [Stellaceae bacterium]
MTISGASSPARKAGSHSEKADKHLAARELEPQERLDWLRLCRSDSVGPVTFYALLRRFGSAAAALDALPRLSKSGGARPVTAMARREAEAELGAIERLGGRLVCWGEALYPEALAAVEDAPPVLTVLGRAELALAPMVAVVGARNASANGRRFARDLAASLGEAGLVVVSGMARGIDAAAHLGALPTGTVAVVAGGVDIVYPEENRGLYEALARDGAILAELPLGSEPQARHFPRRNRIISGIALGVVVVEAAAKSGSLITARFALEQGREVFAVPGSPLDPRCRGCNDLLRNGATLTETAADIIGQLGPQLQGRPAIGDLLPAPPRPALAPVVPRAALPAAPAPVGDDAALDLIVEKLSPTPVAVDELVRQCQLSAASVATLLLELELAGRVERHPGNLVSLR